MRLPAIGAASLLIALTVIPSSLGQINDEMIRLPSGPKWPIELAEPVEEELNETSKMINDSPICFPNNQNPIICFGPVCVISCDHGEETCGGGEEGPGFGVGTYTYDRQWVSIGLAFCH